MDIWQLEQFLCIAKHESLTRAAEELHITQPALSLSLKRFEEEVGYPLFSRSANRIGLNEAGKTAVVHATSILRQVEMLKEDARASSQRVSSLSIAYADPGVRWYCTPRFSVSHPQIEIKDDLYTGDEGANLLRERIYDLVVTADAINDEDIETLPFLEDRVHLSLPQDSPLATRSEIALGEIPAQPLLYPEIGGLFLIRMEKIVTEQKLPLQLVRNNLNVTQHLIRSTNFLATVSTLSKDLRNDGTHRITIPLTDEELSVHYHLSYLKANRGKVSSFVSWAREEVRKETGQQGGPSSP